MVALPIPVVNIDVSGDRRPQLEGGRAGLTRLPSTSPSSTRTVRAGLVLVLVLVGEVVLSPPLRSPPLTSAGVFVLKMDGAVREMVALLLAVVLLLRETNSKRPCSSAKETRCCCWLIARGSATGGRSPSSCTTTGAGNVDSSDSSEE